VSVVGASLSLNRATRQGQRDNSILEYTPWENIVKLAIVCGISGYQHMKVLEACSNDAQALRQILTATGDYAHICFVGPDVIATQAKAAIVQFVKDHQATKVDELFFYFSGHGDRSEDDFFTRSQITRAVDEKQLDSATQSLTS